MSWSCGICNERSFSSRRALSVHSSKCNDNKFRYKKDYSPSYKCEFIEVENNSKHFSSVKPGLEEIDTNIDINSLDDNHVTETFDEDLLNQLEDYFISGFADSINEPEYLSSILLLKILRKAKCPIYLFDMIVDWAKKSHSTYKIDFCSTTINRKSSIDMILKRYDMKQMAPQVKSLFLPGLNQNVKVIIHDFKQCLYSLLMDKELMKEENLLSWEEVNKEIDDINTGSVYKNAKKMYINDPTTERLIPIIFFTDKTHTDIHGRLCLEPVQFTLGIFKRDVRNTARAWRTIGYLTDCNYDKKCSTEAKTQDYHKILEIILASYKNCQKTCIKWKFLHEGRNEYILKIPCLFIIGDTEGHDKLCGRMQGRNFIPYLCRYCDIHKENIDDPFCDSKHTKMSIIKTLVTRNDKNALSAMSMHCIKNAWHDVEFCDTVRGVHGATLAELLHSLQQGIFEYTIRELFSTKKEKKKTTKKRKRLIEKSNEEYVAPSAEDLGRLNVFSPTYEARFEHLCKHFGYILQHQSDRSLPRTYFNTKYMTVTRKNGHEMAGLILVFLTIFSSSEGVETIDRELGTERCAAYIQVLELLLMMESFCKQEKHTKTNLLIAKKGIPLIMNNIKQTINRTEGCGMKIIKFHLMKHFADDVFRYGSMKNYDSAIGERHHCTEVKDPARHTQRRKSKFEEQTAQRYFENLAITIAETDLPVSEVNQEDNLKDSYINKEHNIFYIHEKKDIFKRDWKNGKCSVVNWKDDNLYKQLKLMFGLLVENGSLQSPICFFTQHNRDGCIFRANPDWQETKSPWYDWARIKWDGYNNSVPAQLNIFIDLSSNFVKPFQMGQSFVTESGYYAIGRSFQDGLNVEAHQTSKLVQYGELIYDKHDLPELCIFSVESITNTMVAVPYRTNTSIFNAKEWLILHSKESWYDRLIQKLKEQMSEMENAR